jgi:glucose/arabinose dehydrogenase
MKKLLLITALALLNIGWAAAQGFTRSELTATLTTPWELTYGPDNFLWVTDSGGKVSRVDPAIGTKTVVYTAPDYYPGSPLETSPLCTQPKIRVGTFGLALHPNFMNPLDAYIYYIYSYNSGTNVAPATKFKIVRLTWNPVIASVTAATDLVTLLPTGYDHEGLRMITVQQNGNNYIYVSVGDNGISEINSPTCYSPQSSNPNNFTMDPNYKNGKIHRFNIDGSIPADNPMAGNSMFTRGHRNPQGLIYNPAQNVLYDTEHGDQTDDEINVLESGKNYGWKNVRGYHGDNNFAGEAAYISSYIPNPSIAGDGLKEPLYSWCSTNLPTSTNFLDWCTPAPTDGVYYNSTGIPGWGNSLLVVSLKDGTNTDPGIHQFQLNAAGTGLEPAAPNGTNPTLYFAADKDINGRLRDIAISPDGKKIFLINNGDANRDKITVYTYNAVAGLNKNSGWDAFIKTYPNPVSDRLNLETELMIGTTRCYNILGECLITQEGNTRQLDVSGLKAGVYLLELTLDNGVKVDRRIVKE